VDVSTLEPRPDASAFLSEPVGAAEGAGFPLALLRGEVDCFFRAQHLGLDAMPLEYDFPTRSALPGDGWLARLRAAELRQQLQLLGMERQRLATQGKLLALHSRRLLTEGDRSNRFEETVRIDPTVPDLFPPCNFAEAPCRKPAMPHSLFCFGRACCSAPRSREFAPPHSRDSQTSGPTPSRCCLCAARFAARATSSANAVRLLRLAASMCATSTPRMRQRPRHRQLLRHSPLPLSPQLRQQPRPRPQAPRPRPAHACVYVCVQCVYPSLSSNTRDC
jgi:hypothetical protein